MKSCNENQITHERLLELLSYDSDTGIFVRKVATARCLKVGAHKNGKGWMANISLNGKRRHIGTFPTPQEAHAAYRLN